MYRGAEARRAAAFAAAFEQFADAKLRQQKVDHVPFTKSSRMVPPSMMPSSCCPVPHGRPFTKAPRMIPPSMMPSSSCPDPHGLPLTRTPRMVPPFMMPSSCCPVPHEPSCEHIRQAASRKHLECVKYFWGLRTKGNPEEEYFEKQAVLAALRNMDIITLEYLLSRDCPWDPKLGNGFFSFRQTSPWSEWSDLYDIVFKYKLLTPGTTEDMLQKFMVEGQWDFLEKVHKYGQTFETVDTRGFAFGPKGANVAVLRELHKREAFRTADLSWLTPRFAVAINDLALLKFACELQPAQVVEAKAKVEDPAMREWLDDHIYQVARLVK